MVSYSFSTFPLLLAAGAALVAGQNLPVVDLGITVHRAQLDPAGEFYIFKNIPYAEPPVGNLRFRHPIPYLHVNRTVNDGSAPQVCPQAGPGWFQFSIPLVLQRLAEGGITAPPGPPPTTPQVQSEDCLLLDVSVPKPALDAKQSGTLNKALPVMLWIHGGAYTEGSKDGVDPAGLIAQSRRNGQDGIVFVSINYRLGLFGFPPRKPWMWDVASNAGLYDQRLALEWVRSNTRRFSGDPNAITVIGESAGAGSIVGHLSAFGGIDGTSPFKRAIIQSPAIKPFQDAALYTQLYDQLLAVSNTTGYSELRALSLDQLAGVNSAMVGTAPFASSVFGPNVDGLFVPSHPGRLLATGRVDSAVEVVVAYNLDEGLLFTDPRVGDTAGFEAYLSGLMPSLPAAKVRHLSTAVYPADFSGAALPYTDQIGRTRLAIAEGLIDCFAFGTALAYANRTRAYQFAVFPGMHAQDVAYTFFGRGEEDVADGFGVPVEREVARRMQAWFVDFAMFGFTEGGAGGEGNAVLELPVYTGEANVMNITGSGEGGFEVVRDPAANGRCRFWLEGLSA
ncbi:hypothetical protein MFIFM68171_06632 [Madurella fahalii]|uniref:Carboxylesterase type B domain-containing protein n=1 Tax=Madurella fahalii TaxID=1157608 RepID=A0ABQ0GFB7_9PEZI